MYWFVFFVDWLRFVSVWIGPFCVHLLELSIFCMVWSGLVWIGPFVVWIYLNWSVSVWIGLDWSVSVWIGQDWFVSCIHWSGLVRYLYGLVWIGPFSFWIGLGWFVSGVNWFGSVWIGLDWSGLVWIGLDWFGLDWFGLGFSMTPYLHVNMSGNKWNLVNESAYINKYLHSLHFLSIY
jgi:hypothetical protein